LTERANAPMLAKMKQLARVTAFSLFCMLVWVASPPLALIVFVGGGIMIFSNPS